MDFEKTPEWERSLGLLGETFSLANSLSGDEERFLASRIREAAIGMIIEVAQGIEGGVLSPVGKKAVGRHLVCLMACLEVAVKLGSGSREANNDLLVLVRDFVHQLEG